MKNRSSILTYKIVLVKILMLKEKVQVLRIRNSMLNKKDTS